MEKVITVKVEVKTGYLESVLASASRGTDYWAEGAGELAYESVVHGLLYGGKSVKITDTEDDDKKHTLTLAKIEKGLAIMAKDEPSEFAEILSEDGDMYTGDILLQCALLGEVRYS